MFELVSCCWQTCTTDNINVAKESHNFATKIVNYFSLEKTKMLKKNIC